MSDDPFLNQSETICFDLRDVELSFQILLWWPRNGGAKKKDNLIGRCFRQNQLVLTACMCVCLRVCVCVRVCVCLTLRVFGFLCVLNYVFPSFCICVCLKK